MQTIALVAILMAQAANVNAEESPKAESVSVGNVSSSGSGGVTTGYLGTLNQTTVLPTVVRGPLLEKFRTQFTSGAQLFRTLQDGNLTDEQYSEIMTAIDQWYGSTFNWLNKEVNPWAAERFAFRTASAMGWMLSGTRAPGIVEKRSATLNAMHQLLQNLDQLMREPSIYPEKQ
ncbi:MAG: hypothetical protein ACREDU_08285 [Methylocella sp.]